MKTQSKALTSLASIAILFASHVMSMEFLVTESNGFLDGESR